MKFFASIPTDGWALSVQTDKKWIFLTDFLQIVERLCAKEFDDLQLSVLEGLLDAFFSDFSKQFPDQ